MLLLIALIIGVVVGILLTSFILYITTKAKSTGGGLLTKLMNR